MADKILIAGPGRTGTTLLFNLIRTQFTDVDVKHVHRWDEGLCKWADVVITTKRDFREKIASTKRYLKRDRIYKASEQLKNQGIKHVPAYTSPFSNKINNEDSKTFICNSLEEELEIGVQTYFNWSKHSAVEFVLEEWFTNPIKYLTKFFYCFGHDLSPKELQNVFERFDNKVGIITNLSEIKLKKIKKAFVTNEGDFYHITKDPDKLINYPDTLTHEEVLKIQEFFIRNYPAFRSKFLYIERYEEIYA